MHWYGKSYESWWSENLQTALFKYGAIEGELREGIAMRRQLGVNLESCEMGLWKLVLRGSASGTWVVCQETQQTVVCALVMKMTKLNGMTNENMK